MELLAKIRRWHLRDKVPIREIARRTSLSKNTIKKYLRNQTLEPAYPPRTVSRKLDPYAIHVAHQRVALHHLGIRTYRVDEFRQHVAIMPRHLDEGEDHHVGADPAMVEHGDPSADQSATTSA